MFQITGGIGLYGERLAVALGFITLVAAISAFMSCRSCLSIFKHLRLNKLAESKPFKVFYRYHAYSWWAFLFVLVLHVMTAVMHTGIPTPRDPDSGRHWIVLGFALGSLALLAAVLFSCRSFVAMLSFFTGKSPLGGKRYESFYQYHIYYWWLFLAAIAGHFIAVYSHSGLWPGGGLK